MTKWLGEPPCFASHLCSDGAMGPALGWDTQYSPSHIWHQHQTAQESRTLELNFSNFRLNPRKNFFPLRVTEPWPRLPREAVESPSLEIFKTHLDKVLYSLL